MGLWIFEVLYFVTLIQFQTNRSQDVKVELCCSIPVIVVSEGSVFGPIIVPPVHVGAFLHTREYVYRL